MSRRNRPSERHPNHYLTASLFSLTATANAFKPLSMGTSSGAIVSFAAGWPTAELPLYSLGAQVIATAAVARAGLISGKRGRFGLAVSAVSWAGLLALRLRSRKAAEVLDAALGEALGKDYQARARHPRDAEERAEKAAGKPGVVRLARVRGRYALETDIAYGDARQNQLDIWRRPDLPRDGRAPVLIQIPGGAWITGNKQGQAYPLMTTMAELGWVCVPISYRLSPRASWPDHLVDVKRAIAWVRDNIADYGGDPDFIAITGGSAGGHLSSLAALTFDDPSLQPGFEEKDTSVRAVVPFYGVYDWSNDPATGGDGYRFILERLVIKKKWSAAPEVFRQASPLHRVRPGAPPFFVISAANDTLVVPAQPAAFVSALRAVSTAPVAAAALADAQHAFDIFGSPRTLAAAKAAADFLGVVFADYRATGA